jgi:predicted GIY-YIG superfamily endonuclease
MNKVKGYWTFDKVKEEASKYKVRNDFNKGSKSAYLVAYRNGWINDVCSHMKVVNNYTFDRVKEEALKFSTKNDFREKARAFYTAAHRNGWIDDVCSHMELQGSLYKRHIYKVSFSDNSIYIGLTYNFDKRTADHLIRKNSSVYKHMIDTGLKPTFELVTKELLSNEEASKMECNLIDYYKDLGFNILNRAKGGGLGGSNIIWDIDKVKEDALKYNTRNEFRIKSGSAYSMAHRSGWLDEVCSHMKTFSKPSGYWTIDKLREEALKYNTKKDFERGVKSAYQIAYKNGWLDDVCSHMVSSRKPNGYWTIDRIKEEALKYKSRNDFKKGSPSAYSKALANNLLDDVCSHMLIKNIDSFNEWVLQNVEKENDIYKRTFRKEELQDLLKERKIKVNIL